MSNPSLKIEAHGTPSSLVPGSIQNSRNLELLSITEDIPSGGDPYPLSNIPSDIEGSIVGSSAEIDTVSVLEFSIGTNSNSYDNLLSSASRAVGTYSLLASATNPVTLGDIYVKGGSGFKLTLRLLIKKD